jgi:hypothetical protein
VVAQWVRIIVELLVLGQKPALVPLCPPQFPRGMAWTRTGGLWGKEASNSSPGLRHGLRTFLNCTLQVYCFGVWIWLNCFSIGTASGCGCHGREFIGFCLKQGMKLTGDCFEEEGDIDIYNHRAERQRQLTFSVWSLDSFFFWKAIKWIVSRDPS